jgi:hypothetical protein
MKIADKYPELGLMMALIKSNRCHIQILCKLKEAHLSAPSGSRG